MENETEIELDLDETEETQEEIVEKKQESPEAKLARLDRQAAQLRKKLGVKTEKPAETREERNEDKGGLDRIDKAILRAEKITSSDEIDLFESIKRETGKDTEDVLESRYWKAELKALRDENAAKEALPSNSKRSAQATSNSVDYWLAKGQMPPASEPKLRQAYVNAKMAKTAERTMFTDNPLG